MLHFNDDEKRKLYEYCKLISDYILEDCSSNYIVGFNISNETTIYLNCDERKLSANNSEFTFILSDAEANTYDTDQSWCSLFNVINDINEIGLLALKRKITSELNKREVFHKDLMSMCFNKPGKVTSITKIRETALRQNNLTDKYKKLSLEVIRAVGYQYTNASVDNTMSSIYVNCDYKYRCITVVEKVKFDSEEKWYIHEVRYYVELCVCKYFLSSVERSLEDLEQTRLCSSEFKRACHIMIETLNRLISSEDKNAMKLLNGGN